MTQIHAVDMKRRPRRPIYRQPIIASAMISIQRARVVHHILRPISLATLFRPLPLATVATQLQAPVTAREPTPVTVDTSGINCCWRAHEGVRTLPFRRLVSQGCSTRCLPTELLLGSSMTDLRRPKFNTSSSWSPRCISAYRFARWRIEFLCF